jgi:hypothetical protein
MRKLTFLISVVSIFASCSTPAGEEKDSSKTLELRFTEGEMFQVKMTWDEKVSWEDSTGAKQESPIFMEDEWNYEVLKVDANGTADIKITTTRIHFGNYDSADSSTWNDPYAPFLSMMLKFTPTVRIAKDGSVIYSEGAKGMYLMGDTTRKLDEENIYRENLNNVFAFLPEQKVDSGSNWQRSDTVNFGYPAYYKHNFQIKKMADGKAYIETESLIKPNTDAPPTIFPGGFILPRQELDGTRHGTIVFDYEKGRIDSIEFTTELGGPATVSQGEKEFEMKLNTNLKVKYEFLYAGG